MPSISRSSRCTSSSSSRWRMVTPGGNPALQRVLVRLVGHHDDLPGAFGQHLAGDLRHRQRAVDALAAGHRDGVVVEDLEGDVDAGRDRGADAQAAGMEVGAVAEVLEHVRRASRTAPRRPSWRPRRPSGCSPWWRGPSTAPCSGSRCRRARCCRPAPGSRCCAGSPSRNTACAGSGSSSPCSASWRRRSSARRCGDRIVGIELQDALGERERHLIARERAVRGEQRRAALVALAHDLRRVRPAVQQLLELGLDQGALLLDHDDLLEAGGERAHALGLERPDQAELEHAQAKPGGELAVDAEVGERLAQVQIRLAGRDDAEARVRAVEHQPVERVGPGERAHRLQLEAMQPLLLGERGIGPADVETARRQREVIGRANRRRAPGRARSRPRC